MTEKNQEARRIQEEGVDVPIYERVVSSVVCLRYVGCPGVGNGGIRDEAGANRRARLGQLPRPDCTTGRGENHTDQALGWLGGTSLHLGESLFPLGQDLDFLISPSGQSLQKAP
jgi:hypothetical protein